MDKAGAKFQDGTHLFPVQFELPQKHLLLELRRAFLVDVRRLDPSLEVLELL